MGTNKKQTAVQQLWDELEELNLPNWQRDFRPILMKAKLMEREQIYDAFNFGDYNIDLPDGSWEQKYKSPQQYYEENYGN